MYWKQESDYLMTKQMNYNLTCHICNVDLVCSQCKEKQLQGTPFSLWTRKQPELDSRTCGFDANNLDFMWFNYKKGWYILLEEKQYGGNQSESQCDSHNILHQMCRISNNSEVNTWRGKRKIEYRGYYLIQFEKTNPNDSEWVKINGKICDKYDLMRLLKTGSLEIEFDW